MNNLFQVKEPINPNFFQRLFKQSPQENAIVEINNLFATKPLREIKSQEIESISAKYKINLRKKFYGRLKEIYLLFLKQYLSDRVLTNEETVYLNHLKILLSLEDNEVEELHSQVAGEIYRQEFKEKISDGQIDKSKEEILDKLKENLKLPTIIEEKISDECRNQFLQIKFDLMVKDGRISPYEWERFTTFQKDLRYNIIFDEAQKAKIEKFKFYWLIENGDLPAIPVGINLQKDEKCYYSIYSEWLEHRTVTRGVNYGGPYLRFKFMKGVYYRAGNVGIQRITSDVLSTIDTGTTYVTNKRLIFMGNKKNMNIQLNKILSVTPYSDGVGIEKDSGKSPILRVLNNADILAMIMSRVINDL
jgi:hypothetical protein